MIAIRTLASIKKQRFPAEHIGGRIGFEEPLHAEPPHDTTAHLLVERGEIGLRGSPSKKAPLKGLVVKFFGSSEGMAQLELACRGNRTTAAKNPQLPNRQPEAVQIGF